MGDMRAVVLDRAVAPALREGIATGNAILAVAAVVGPRTEVAVRRRPAVDAATRAVVSRTSSPISDDVCCAPRAVTTDGAFPPAQREGAGNGGTDGEESRSALAAVALGVELFGAFRAVVSAPRVLAETVTA